MALHAQVNIGSFRPAPAANVEYAGLAGSGTNRGMTSNTVSVTVADNSNRFLLIGIGAYVPSGASVTSVTVNGNAATQISHNKYYDGVQLIALYGFVAPAVGTYNVVVNFSGTTNASSVGVASFYNVNQTTPYSNLQTAASVSVNVTSASGNMVADLIVVYPENTYSPGAGQTQIVQLNDNPGDPGTITAMSYEAGAGTTTMSWSPTSDNPSIAAININKI